MYPYNKDQKHSLKATPLMCWDTLASFLYEKRSEMIDLKYLTHFLSNKRCNTPDTLSNCLKHYDCVIITSTKKIIFWVSEGFSLMTGYPKEEALNRTPAFLQKRNMCMEVKERINKNLGDKKRVREKIVNYKKNGQEYICDICIEPVYSLSNELTHFIAFEKEV